MTLSTSFSQQPSEPFPWLPWPGCRTVRPSGCSSACAGLTMTATLLLALRLHDGLHGPPPERRSPLALQSLPQGFLGRERDAVRVPQDAAAVPPDGDCNLRE